MHAYTVITTENDAVQIQAQLEKDGTYRNPMLSFYTIDPSSDRNWRNTDDTLAEIWDNSTFLIDDLYVNVVKHSNLGMCSANFDPELKALLESAMVSLDELKELMTNAIEIGFFSHVECEFFS